MKQMKTNFFGSARKAAVILFGLVCFSAPAFAQGIPAATNLPPTAVVTNRAPLFAPPFAALPLGSIRPQGWLLTQCQQQRDGLTGNAEAVYAVDIGTNSAWLGGTGDSWERSPYYYKGLISLAYVMNDAGLKQKAQKWIDWLLTHQGADGYLGPAANNDWWPRMLATYALRDYYEATADARVPNVSSSATVSLAMPRPSTPLISAPTAPGSAAPATAGSAALITTRASSRLPT